MKLYIMRHGDASAAQPGQKDADRILSAEGEREALTNAKWLADRVQNQALDLVISSPYARARNTATIVHSVLASDTQELCNDVTPDGVPAQFISYLQAIVDHHDIDTTDGRVLVVSHMPFVCYLVAELDHRVQPPIFPTAGIAEIDFDVDAGKGKLSNMIIADHCV